VNGEFAPVRGRFWTTGVKVMLVFMFAGAIALLARFFGGLGYITNNNDAYPWGLWIGVNVAGGVGLAAGGFTTGAIAYVLNRKQFHLILRPALFTALLGYTFVIMALLTDLGRYWNMYSPMINWNFTSVLFAVAICVMISTTILYIECIPIVAERFIGNVNLPPGLRVFNTIIDRLLKFANNTIDKVMIIVVIVGIVFSCLHQSSLGALMLIAPSKVHPLWYTPILPLLFLMSAIAAAYPVVIFEHLLIEKSLDKKPRMDILTPMARFMPVLMGIYLVLKIGDMVSRETYVYLFDGTAQTNAFLVEVIFGVICPFVLVLFQKVRKSPGWLFFTSCLAIFGILINRINVFIVSYSPPYGGIYYPSIGEIIVTIGFISTLFFVYRLGVTNLPILAVDSEEKAV
jgi:Ni/Fe-hydrogenase subunit HybB-like protein